MGMNQAVKQTIPDSPAQLEFKWRDARALCEELEAHTGLTLQLTVTNNRSSVMFVRHDRLGGSAQVRLHHMFLSASETVVRALATWIRSPRARKSGGILDLFIRENTHLLRPAPLRPQPCRTRGLIHDLRIMYDELNARHFNNTVTAALTWGKQPTTQRRRSIRFGSYSPGEHIIRIHPLLDQEFVPAYFVRYIVFHEMLHAFLGIEDPETGRRRIHTGEFRRSEQAYPDYAIAFAWQAQHTNLRKLLAKHK